MKKRILSVALAAVAVSAFAAPTVEVTRVCQRFPWNNGVDIDYAVSGFEGSPENCTVEFAISGATNGVPVALTAKWFLSHAACDLPTADGAHRATWDPVKEGLAGRLDGLAVTAKIVSQPCTEAAAEFMVVDLSAGASGPYPVRFVASDVVTSEQFANCNRYKETCLVMKRVPAQSRWLGKGGQGLVEKQALLAWLRSAVDPNPSVYARIWEYRHYVTLTKSYWMGVFPVTYGQYRQVLGKYPTSTNGATDGVMRPDVALRPLAGISYNAFMQEGGFVALLNARCAYQGRPVVGFGLPTEAQWECMARAGTETKAYWGDGLNLADYDPYEWCSGNSGAGQHPVGLKLPNPWGFYDTLGNVNEYCCDSYSATDPVNDLVPTDDDTIPLQDREPVPIVDPFCETGSSRLLKGGSYGSVGNCGSRTYNSNGDNSEWYSGQISYPNGFRLCREAN